MEATRKLQKVSPTLNAAPFCFVFSLLVLVPFLILLTTSSGQPGDGGAISHSLREVLSAGNPPDGDLLGFWGFLCLNSTTDLKNY